MAYAWLSDGTPLYYDDRGSGPPVLLIHALMYSVRYFWKPILGPLSAGARVIAVDMRGHGESGKPDHGYCIEQLANDVDEFVRQQKLERIVIVGVALGGLVALNYLQRFGTQRVRGLAIAEMTPRLVSEEGWAHPTFGDFPRAAADAFGTQVRTDRSRAGLRQFFAASTAQPPSEQRLDEMVAELYLMPTEAIASLCDDMVRQDVRAQLPEISIPTLLMYGGAQNKILPTGIGRWMQSQIPRSKLVEFDHSGHMPFLEEPEKFSRELLQFVHDVE